MIGVIVAGHGGFAREIISILQNIMGEQKHVQAVSVGVGEGEHFLRDRLEAALETMEVDEVLILSDIFGGSISNTCLYFAKSRKHVAVVTGVNLPMLLKVITYRESGDLSELVSLACKGGREGILDACGLLDKAG